MNRHINNILICAGSRDGNDPSYKDAAAKIGQYLGQDGYNVIYGGGNVGLMGAAAMTALTHGSKVIGYLHDIFNRYAANIAGLVEKSLSNLFLRKENMLDASDATIVLPGGVGTLDEAFEMAAHNDINRYIDAQLPCKPVLFLNINGFFEGMKLQIDRAVRDGFISPETTKMFFFEDTPEAIRLRLRQLNAQPPILGADLSPEYKC